MAETAAPQTRARGATGSPEIRAAAAEVGALFSGLVSRLDVWRARILEVGPLTPAALNERVASIVLAELESADPLLIGAGFIASPEFANTPDVHFAWWLGPLDENPVYGATTQPTRLDLSARADADRLRDLRSLEWYRIPETTHQAHITGPYVDLLCACDYIVTVTAPIQHGGAMIGVVGMDLYVKRLERELLPMLLRLAQPAVLANASGRVLVSTDPSLCAGSVADTGPGHVFDCPGTPFRLILTSV